MTHQDWATLAKTIVFLAAIGLAGLYFLEWNGPLTKAGLKKTNATIWKKPKGWQVITLRALWTFVIVGVAFLFWLDRAR